MFSPFQVVWTPTIIDDLRTRFVLRPDETKGKSFEDKFRDQLKDAPAATILLAAEMVYVHLLISTQLKGSTKRQLIQTVMSFGTAIRPMPAALDTALDRGLCNAGRSFLQHRPSLLKYLVEFARAWKALDPDTRSAALADPWTFKRFVFSVPAPAARIQQHALLHLVHPDTFESIVSEAHKVRIVEAFLPDASHTTDIDEQLQRVREILTPKFGQGFSFYSSEVKPEWQREDELAFSADDFELFQRYRRSVNFGGIPAADKKHFSDLRERVQQILESTVSLVPQVTTWNTHLSMKNPNGNTAKDFWCALYPSDALNKSYAVQTAFIISERGVEVCFCLGAGDSQIRDSEERQANESYFLSVRKRLQGLTVEALASLGKSLDDKWYFRRQWRLPPGPRDFDTLQEWRDYATAPGGEGASISRYFTPDEVSELGDEVLDQYQDAVERFLPFFAAIAARQHPPVTSTPPLPPPDSPRPVFTRADALADLFMSADELDVILARLKRKKALILQGPPGVGKTFVSKRLAFALMGERDERRVAMVQFHPSYGYEDFVQGFRPTPTGLARHDGAFHKFAELARKDPARDWFFIIDEINRGNLAKIFGELLVLIEADKRGPDHAMPLTYSTTPGDTFYLPANLYFIGTMNTADRSLAMVDYALRRRFSFATLGPALDSPAFSEWLKEHGAAESLIARIRSKIATLNAVIENERDLGHGFKIGHSFFCPSDGQAPDETWFREVIAGEIQPLLEEYFDSRQRVEQLVAELLAD
jgi:5-methylcytosine-specific restriction protein B